MPDIDLVESLPGICNIQNRVQLDTGFEKWEIVVLIQDSPEINYRCCHIQHVARKCRFFVFIIKTHKE